MKKSQFKSLVKMVIKEMTESTEPSIGGSFGDQQNVVGNKDPMQGERDPLFDPLLTGAPLKEYNDLDSKLKSIQYRKDDATKLIYMWVKQGAVSFADFNRLLQRYIEIIIEENEPTKKSSGLRGDPQ